MLKRNILSFVVIGLIIIAFVVIIRNALHVAKTMKSSKYVTSRLTHMESNSVLVKVNDIETVVTEILEVRPNYEDLVDSRDLTSFDTDASIEEKIEKEQSWLKQLKDVLGCYDRKLVMEKVPYGRYWLVKNFIRGTASINAGCADKITYTTNGDYTFFDTLAMVVKRWLGPVSFAIHAPGYDLNATLDSIQYVRNCLPESELIRQHVTFHVYFPKAHMPPYLPLNEKMAFAWPFDCATSKPPYENVQRGLMYKSLKNLTYPINVGRNIARKAANTYFVFPCDIELFPSPGLADKFLKMVHNNTSILDKKKKRVFVLPVFEVEKNAHVPENKTDLVKMLRAKSAIPFHSKICKNCHLVPKYNEWIKASDSNNLTLFSKSKRIDNYKYWEPFYISDNKEPMFDERVTWEGQKNKRIQGFAMCLLDYEYHVLHPAFLVHNPGIKYFNKNSTRLKYVPEMNTQIKKIIEPEYKILYGKNAKCKT